MMSMKIRAMYFTGTGTTAKITTSIAYSMWSEMKDAGFEKEADINFAVKAARDKEYIFDEKDIVVFGVPVIAGRVPNVLLKFLDTLKGGGAIAIPVVLYGNRNFDDALIELRNILEDKDFRTVAAAAFIGEHSFSKTLAAGRPDAADMKIADAFAKEAADK
ncbi:MAG: flavodoxin family protein, partial [Firmicutes bacterium]|nr:flavodoxin family protein [Bacillota bacterium]